MNWMIAELKDAFTIKRGNKMTKKEPLKAPPAPEKKPEIKQGHVLEVPEPIEDNKQEDKVTLEQVIVDTHDRVVMLRQEIFDIKMYLRNLIEK